MKKIISMVLVLTMVLALAVPATAVSKVPAEIKIEGASISASVDKLTGNQNKLWITIKDSSGSKTESYMIANNAEGTYPISTENGDYEAYVDTKGNTQIRACYIVSFSDNGGGTDLANYSSLDNAIYSAEALDQNDFTTESWAILSTAVEDGKTVERNLTASSQYYIDTLTHIIVEAIYNLVMTSTPEGFISFTASVSEVFADMPFTVSFFAEVADTFVPQDGRIFVFYGNSVLLELYDNGYDSDDIAGDNVYSGTANISIDQEGVAKFHAEANDTQSKPLFITVYNLQSEEAYNITHLAQAEIESAVNPDDSIEKQLNDAVIVVQQQKAAGLVIEYWIHAASIEIEYSSGITYLFSAHTGLSLLATTTAREQSYSFDFEGVVGEYEDHGIAFPEIMALAAVAGKNYNGNFLIVLPYENTWNQNFSSAPYSAYYSVESVSNYQGNVLKYSDVSVNGLKTAFNGYEIINWSGHGGYTQTAGAFLFTGENKNNSYNYQADFTAKRLIQAGDRICITGKFIEYYYKEGALNDALVFLNACHSLDGNALSSAFRKIGAKTVLGFDNTVLSVYGNDMNKTLFEELIKQNDGQYATVYSALQKARDKHGITDCDLWFSPEKTLKLITYGAAALIIHGDINYRLFAQKPVDNYSNPSFESGKTAWTGVGDFRVVSSLGTLKPTHGNYMALAGTGLGGLNYGTDTNIQSSIKRQFFVSKNQKLIFDYNFVSEEPMEYVGSIYDDTLLFIVKVNGTENVVRRESVNTSNWLYLGGNYFYGGDDTTYHTGWKTLTIDFNSIAGITTNTLIELEIRIFDQGDSIYDSAVLVDNLRWN